ncbi:hypothetical protein U3516DRAFT_740221 [Neocallimastix sp. 'constans']
MYNLITQSYEYYFIHKYDYNNYKYFNSLQSSQAYWLRSSVVSVLFSVTTETRYLVPLVVLLIFENSFGFLSLLRAKAPVFLVLHYL